VIPSHQPHHGVLTIEGNGGLGDDELQFQYMQKGWVTGWQSYDRSPSGFTPGFTIPVGPSIGIDLTGFDTWQREGLSPVGPGLGSGATDPEDVPVFEPWVERPEGPPVDWDQVYAEFVILNPETPATVYADVPVIDPDFNPKGTVSETDSGNPVAVISEEPVAFWDAVGDFFTTVAPVAAYDYGAGQGWWGGAPQTGMQNPFPSIVPSTTPGFPSGPGAPGNMPTPQQNVVPIVQDQSLCAVPATNPRYLRYNCQTGAFSKVPRRRRRRLLTSSDLKDLAALKAIVGGGAKMDGAIVQAIRR